MFAGLLPEYGFRLASSDPKRSTLHHPLNNMTDQAKFTAKLKGKKALVIGGSSGIGYGVAEALVEHGATVIISSSNQRRVDSAISALQKSYPSSKSHVTGHACDLSDKDNAQANIKNLFALAGKVDHVVCTATDALPVMPLQAMTSETIQKAGQIRFIAPFLVAKHAANYVDRSANSSITFTGGVVAERPMPDWSLVTAYTTGVQGLARALAIDLKPIRVNIVQPGMTAGTNIFASSGIPDDAKQSMFEQTSQRSPVQKVGTPEDLAEAYLYLITDGNVTGETVNSSGGHLII